MIQKITLIRHGMTEGNFKRTYTGKTDVPLCELGIKGILERKGTYPLCDCLFVSDLRRSQQTAALIYPHMEQIIVPDIRECDMGDFEGKTYDELKTDPDYQRFLDPNDGYVPNGECLEVFNERCKRGFLHISKIIEEKGCKDPVIVTHGGVIMAVLNAFCREQKVFYDYQTKNGDGFEVTFDTDTFIMEKIRDIKEDSMTHFYFDALELAKHIEPLDKKALEAASERQKNLIKPMGSLGVLEDMGIRLSGIFGENAKAPFKKIHFLFGADNGVCAQGITASPISFTHMLMDNYGKGMGCGINVLCRHFGVDFVPVDVGIIGEFEKDGGVLDCKIAEGTADFSKEPAMTEEQLKKALSVGFSMAKKAKDEGYNIVGGGEVGMGNTTTAAAVIMALLGTMDTDLIGRGGGLTDEALENKKNVIKNALIKYGIGREEAVKALMCVGGFDIAALTALYLGCAYYRLPVVLDGVISISAALAACRINPLVKNYMFASHISKEPAYLPAVKELELRPILELDMRLGEGSGCPVAMSVIESAAAVLTDMMTFEELKFESEYRKNIKYE